MERVAPTGPGISDLYMRIRKARPNWFTACPRIAIDDYPAFDRWIRSWCSYWYDNGSNVVFVELRGHVAESHFVFLGKIDKGFLENALDETRKDVDRIEIPFTGGGHVMRNLMRSLGFQLEGIMRRKQRYHNALTGTTSFLDVEMWATLSERSF